MKPMMTDFSKELPFPYRGISVEDGTEVYGFYCQVDGKPAIFPSGLTTHISPAITYIPVKECVVFIIPETLSVFTGTTDVKGRPIFTKDIVETFSIYCTYRQVGDYPPPNIECEEWEVQQSESEVEFIYGSFVIGSWPINLDKFYDDEYAECFSEDEEGKRHFEANWEDNSYNIRDKYPYLTWDYFKKPHIIGHSYDELLKELFPEKFLDK